MGTPAFDRDYWERHWALRHGHRDDGLSVNPHVVDETPHLAPGTALDAGCGTGAEAIWLARRGWQVTGADISPSALSMAAAGAERAQVQNCVDWLEQDLTLWRPEQQWDLVVTSYAHPSIPQLTFYSQLGGWVAAGGTLLIVAHLGTPRAQALPVHDHPEEATAMLADVVELFNTPAWRIETARRSVRTVAGPDGGVDSLHDLIVRVRRPG